MIAYGKVALRKVKKTVRRNLHKGLLNLFVSASPQVSRKEKLV